jgi:transcription antitermination factor NusA-like protein
MALGERGSNLKRISDIIKKRVRIIAKPNSIQDARAFIQAVVAPVEFKDLEMKDNEIILTAGMQSKAALLGRNKRRLVEMQSIIKDFFDVEFKII